MLLTLFVCQQNHSDESSDGLKFRKDLMSATQLSDLSICPASLDKKVLFGGFGQIKDVF